MKIGIDVTPILYEGTGVGEYTRQLVGELLRQNPDDEFMLFFSTLRGFNKIKEKLKEWGGDDKVHVVGFPFPPVFWQFVWNKLNLIKIEWLIGKVDVFHCWDYLIPPSNCPRIVTIHDLTPILYPGTHTIKIVDNFKLVLQKIRHEKIPVLTVSENSKKDLIKHAGINADSLHVVYNGKDKFEPPVSNTENISDKYILCVGTREPRKNLNKVVAAFNLIAGKYPELRLIIVGKYGWGKELVSSIKNRVKILGFISREKLIHLYKNAVCLVYPSLYEGFGLPVLDAMSLGCPVITSKTSSLPEVGGEAVLYVNPNDEKEISASIMRMIEESELRNELIKKGLVQAEKFSWEKCARETREIYGQI